MSTQGKTSTYDVHSDSEDELDWEEGAVPQAQHIELEDQAGPSMGPNIEVILEAYPTRRKGDTQYAVFLFISHINVLSCVTGKSPLAGSRMLNASSASTVTKHIPSR